MAGLQTYVDDQGYAFITDASGNYVVSEPRPAQLAPAGQASFLDQLGATVLNGVSSAINKVTGKSQTIQAPQPAQQSNTLGMVALVLGGVLAVKLLSGHK